MQNATVSGVTGVSFSFGTFYRVTIGLLVMVCLAPVAAAHEVKINGVTVEATSIPPRDQILDDIKAQIDKTTGLEARAEILKTTLDGLWREDDQNLFIELLGTYRATISNLAHGSRLSVGHKFNLAEYYVRLDDRLTAREILLELEQIALVTNPVDGWDECDSDGCTHNSVWSFLQSLASGYEAWLDDRNEALRLYHLAVKIAEGNASDTEDFALEYFYRRVLSDLYDLEDYEGAENLLNRMIKQYLGADRQSGFTRNNLIVMSVLLDEEENPDTSSVLSRTILFWSDDAFYPETGIRRLIDLGNRLRHSGFQSSGRLALTAAEKIYEKSTFIRNWDSLTVQFLRAYKSFDEPERAVSLFTVYRDRVLAQQSRSEKSLWSLPGRSYNLEGLARTYISFGDLEGAIQILEMIGDSDTRARGNLYFALAYEFLEAKDIVNARTYIELALGSRPDDETESSDSYGYASSGNSGMALQMYIRLALFMEEEGDDEDAAHYFEHAYSLAMTRPPGPQRVWALIYLTSVMNIAESELTNFLQTTDVLNPSISPASLHRPFQ